MKIRFIQSIIDRLRNKIDCLDLFVATESAFKKSEKYKTIILGSSHTFRYKPNSDEINLSMTSQDLYSSYMMYEKFNTPNVKNIVVGFSVFTPGFCAIKTAGDWQKSILYKLFYGIDYEYEDVARERKLYQKEKYFTKIINKKRKAYLSGKNIERKVGVRTDEAYIKARTAGHLKNNRREPDEMHWCRAFIEAAEKNGQNLFFYIPPAMRTYKDRLPSSDILFKKLYDCCQNKSHVHILNYYDSDVFGDSDFADCDHLNSEAWNDSSNKKCMTEIIREAVYNAVV